MNRWAHDNKKEPKFWDNTKHTCWIEVRCKTRCTCNPLYGIHPTTIAVCTLACSAPVSTLQTCGIHEALLHKALPVPPKTAVKAEYRSWMSSFFVGPFSSVGCSYQSRLQSPLLSRRSFTRMTGILASASRAGKKNHVG